MNYPAGHAARLPTVPSSAYVVADAGTGQVLAAKDPHGLLLPASTLKMLTAVTLVPLLNPAATVVASAQATNVTPNIAGLVRGQPYRVADLFRALLLISANDAAIALAQATGSLSQGIALMNAEAHHLQAYDVMAADPNGLDAPGQHVSAYDLALIARQALAMPALMGYDATRIANFAVTARKSETLYNQNELLARYPGGIGGKIGWTSAAGATYIGMARRNGVTLIVTILHCTPLTEVTYASKLLDWGFAQDGKVRPIGTLVRPITAAPAESVPEGELRLRAAPPGHLGHHHDPEDPGRAGRRVDHADRFRGRGRGDPDPPAAAPRPVTPLGVQPGHEADPVPHPDHGLAGHPAGPGGAVSQDLVQTGLVGEHLPGPLPDRRERRDHDLGQVLLERRRTPRCRRPARSRRSIRRSGPSRYAAGS